MGATKMDKDATRAERKAKKRKAENAIPDLPGDSEVTQDVDSSSKKRKHRDDDSVSDPKSEKKVRKHEKKAKKNNTAPIGLGSDADEQVSTLLEKPTVLTAEGDALSGDGQGTDSAISAPKKLKKERKAERKAAEAAAAAAASTTDAKETDLQQEPDKSVSQPEAGSAEPTKSKKNNRNREKKRQAANSAAGQGEDTGKIDKKAARFIVFIGNLPFTATTASIEKHFAAVKPKSVRHLTQKEDPTKSKGCAFVEFDGYDHMKTCLKQLHHSTFDDGLSAPRKINVELTAGGGGKTKHRTAKIGEKNQKLNEERIRRMHEEDKAKLVKREAAIDHDSVHPSRRARVPDVS